jgi:hypothetical protein
MKCSEGAKLTKNMAIAFATIRVKEVHAKNVKGCEEHNRRLYTEDKMPANINPGRIYLNNEWIAGDKPTFKEAIKDKLEGLTVRKNAVVALEFVMGASPTFFEKGSYSASGYLDHCVSFIIDRHGRDNVVSINQHFDEETPHVHVLVTPIREKEVKWKNQRGEGQTTERRLCARDFTGNRKMLSQLQDDFFNHCVPIGHVAQLPFTRHTPAREQVRVYSERTDYRMAEIIRLGQQAEQAVNLANQLELQRRILKEKEKLEKELKEKREAEQKAAYAQKIHNDRSNNRGPKMGGRGM